MSLQKRANFSACGPISACATNTPILVEIGLSYPILSYPVLSAGCFRCLAVNSVLD